MRDLDGWLRFQQLQHPQSIELGLDRVLEVASRLDLVELPYRSVLVGGTNGKGSTVATLSALSRARGLRTGSFTSPHLVRYNERIAIDGQTVDDAALVAAFEQVESTRRDIPLTFFEYSALAAHQLFRSQGVQVAIVEVGLGGRLDATNAFAPDVSVVTSIGLDHMEWLGPTTEHIGREKAGIFRAGRPAILGSAQLPASIQEEIDRLGALARWPGKDFQTEIDADGRWTLRGWGWQHVDLPAPALAGHVQYANAAAAVAAFHALLESARWTTARNLSTTMVCDALQSVTLPGRFQIRPGHPQWILDVAHNPAAAIALAEQLQSRPCEGRTLAVVGILADKDASGIAAALRHVVDAWVPCTLAGPRGRTAQQLAREIGDSASMLALAGSVARGCEIVQQAARPADRIVVLGSFHAVGPALEWLGLY